MPSSSAAPRPGSRRSSEPGRARRTARRAFYIVALALAAATVAAALGDVWWVFDVANEFRLQLLVASLVLIGGAALLRQPRLALVGLLCFVVHSVTVFGPLLVPRAQAATGAGTPFRLTTLNLYDVNSDHRSALDYVGRMQARYRRV